MRAVTGTITSSKPISVSKASSILSRFAAAATTPEFGAHRDVIAYLNRAADSVHDLASFHRDLKRSTLDDAAHQKEEAQEEIEDTRSIKKKKKDKGKGSDVSPSDELKSKVKIESLEVGEAEEVSPRKKKISGVIENGDLGEVEESSRQQQKKKKKKEKRRDFEANEEVKVEDEEDMSAEGRKKKDKKEREIVENGDGKKRKKHSSVKEEEEEEGEYGSERREKKKKRKTRIEE